MPTGKGLGIQDTDDIVVRNTVISEVHTIADTQN